MSTPGSPSLAPIALKRDEGDALWAFGGLALIKASSEATDGRVLVVEMLAPPGSWLATARAPSRGRVVLRDRRRADVLGRRTGDQRAGRIVRLWPTGHPPHVRCRLGRGPLPAGDRARGFRDVHARGQRAGADSGHPAATDRATRPRRAHGPGRGIRHRDTRTTRHPGIARAPRREARFEPLPALGEGTSCRRLARAADPALRARPPLE